MLHENIPASQVVLVVKNVPANAGDMRHGFSPWIGKVPRRKAWEPTPVFLPGESHGQRSLVGCSSQGHKQSDTTETTKHTHTHPVTNTTELLSRFNGFKVFQNQMFIESKLGNFHNKTSTDLGEERLPARVSSLALPVGSLGRRNHK